MAYIGAGITRFNTADDLTVTDDATIQDDASVGGNLSVTGTTTLTDDLNIDSGTLFVDASANAVGIGTTSPDGKMHLFSASAGTVTAANGGDELVLENSSTVGMTFLCPNNSAANILFGDPDDNNVGSIQYGHDTNYMAFATNASERMRLDSSGNLLVGTTDTNPVNNSDGATGVAIKPTGELLIASDGDVVCYMNRQATDGAIQVFRKDGTTVGSIGASGGFLTIGDATTGLRFVDATIDRVEPWNLSANAIRDNAVDLGYSSNRFGDIYSGNGTIQTSDRNEKQDIASLTTAEMAVAARLANQFKTFRWIDSVTEKGDNARTHTGIIAQDVQQAFTDEGLDAGDYAMFISTTWWETQTDVPAVEAVDEVLDEDGNVVTEAVEARAAYIRTKTYDTADEAPEGATERTRMGIRYPELLSFLQAYNDQRMTSIEARLDALEAN